MSLSLRTTVAGAVIGALAGGFLALPSILPPALADEQPMRTLLSTADELLDPHAFDPNKLVKFDIEIEPWVATEVLDTQSVRKIGYGRTEFVTVARTASGTYSSDGIASPHVLYPGIHVEEPTSERPVSAISTSIAGYGWTLGAALDAGSFMSISRFAGGAVITTDRGTCVISGHVVMC